LSVGADDFYFLLSLVNFHKTFGEWPGNQILIPDWTYFNCPGATLVMMQLKSLVWSFIGTNLNATATTVVKLR